MSGPARYWSAALAGPLAWFASMLVNFALAPRACNPGNKFALFAVVIAALIVTASAGLFAWKLWRDAGADLPGEAGGAVAFYRTMALAGMLLNAAFVIVIVAQCVPDIIFRGCE